MRFSHSFFVRLFRLLLPQLLSVKRGYIQLSEASYLELMMPVLSPQGGLVLGTVSEEIAQSRIVMLRLSARIYVLFFCPLAAIVF